MMEIAGHGIHFLTSITLPAVSLVVFAFVDDTDLVIVSHNRDDTVETLFSEIQAALDRWSGLQISTGGSLSPSKSFYYLINFAWENKTKHYGEANDIEGDFNMKMKDHSRHPMQRYDVDRAERP